ncbi:MAG: AAA family ATPase [Anaerolineae bacterium]|nr:AAA family ATPase [Anaerolineae bacterium]
MTNQFTWIDLYQELATVLSDWQERQTELIAFLEELRKQGCTITALQDKNRDGERFLLKEIDPFTFFGVFNRGITDNKRIDILIKIKQYFNLQSPIPSDFDGLPILNNMRSWYFPYHASRNAEDIPRLWHVFQLALQDNPLQDKNFLEAFDKALTIWSVNVTLTMGLFWIRPYTFLSLDSHNRNYLGVDIPKEGLSAQFYNAIMQEASARGQSFPELSWAAWQESQNAKTDKPKPSKVEKVKQKDHTYWMVGAYWNDKVPADQTQRFLDEGVWENGYEDRYLDEVKAMQVSDKIAIKAATTQRKNLPFDAHDKTVSRMDIKAIGTIVANRGDGRTVEVEWDPDFQEKSWYFYTNRSTIWRLQTDEQYDLIKLSKRLINFTWYGEEQDYTWFCEQWWGTEKSSDTNPPVSDEITKDPYSLEDLIAAGVFLSEDNLRRILDRLREKKAIILQGPPGVGKTFIARKLAYALMEEVDNERLEMVQFHQSYSYDDFVRGYRPSLEQPGSFCLQDGIFYKFSQKASANPEHEYVFIIDEINRGNLSLIFGELLMLIEGDKRGREFAVHLVYKNPDEARFYIPDNLHLIGLMNVADRSLAMVDYALRRRFAFMPLQPQYESALFRQWLLDRSMPEEIIDRIISRMSRLNREIKEDPLLGENYQVGHSYFCPKGDNFGALNQDWYDAIIETEIAPLLKEYWFDNAPKVDEAVKQLLD